LVIGVIVNSFSGDLFGVSNNSDGNGVYVWLTVNKKIRDCVASHPMSGKPGRSFFLPRRR